MACQLGLDPCPVLSQNAGTNPVGTVEPSHADVPHGFTSTERGYVAEGWFAVRLLTNIR